MTGRRADDGPELRVVPGAGVPEHDALEALVRRALGRRLTERQVRQIEEGLEEAAAFVDALDLVESAYGAVTPRLALDQAQLQAERLGDDVVRLRGVAASLATLAVWMLPPASTSEIRTAEEISDRQRQLQRWVWDHRRAVMRRMKAGRDRLREARQPR